MVRLIVRIRESLEADKIAAEEAKAKEAAEKAAAEKAIADAAAAEKAAELAKKQEAIDASIIKQAELLAEIKELLKNK
jgi:hypothetical protein